MRVVKTKFGEFVVSIAVPFILGLTFSYQLIESAFLNILMTHLSDEWKHEELQKSVQVVILQGEISAVLQIVFAVCADAYTGNFVMLALSSIVSVAGLLLTSVEAFYPGLLLMSLSQAAKDVTLKVFLHDQLVPRDRKASEDEEERAEKSLQIWMVCASSLADIAAVAVSRVHSLRFLAIILASVMGFCLILFLFGKRFYNRLRWLDRAAQPIEQVKGVKCLMKMIPMWLTFVIFCLVYSSGRTFILQEAKSITGNHAPTLLFLVLPKFVEFGVSGTKLGYVTTQKMKLVRIGVGMLCSVLCCVCSWINALNKLPQFADQPSLHNYLSLLRLLPHFFFLALMETLTINGLEQFFNSKVSKSISRYGPPSGEFVIGVGNFLSVIIIHNMSRRYGWFEDTVENSLLGKYYFVLTVSSFFNFLFYCWVAHWYGADTFLSEEDRAQADIEMDPISD